MEKKEFKYTIGDKVYYQRELVIGQVNQLIEVTKDIEIPETATVLDLVTLLGSKLPKVIAIILSEANISLKEKSVEATMEEIQFLVTTETALGVLEDFFDCNQISSLLNRVGGLVEKVVGKTIIPEKTETQQTDFVQSSQEETLQNEMI